MPRRSVKRRSRTSRTLRWLAVGTFVVISLAYVRPLQAYFRAKDEVAMRRAQVARMTADRSRLEDRLADAGTDEFVEREARKLGLVKPGERLFIVKGLGKGARLR